MAFAFPFVYLFNRSRPLGRMPTGLGDSLDLPPAAFIGQDVSLDAAMMTRPLLLQVIVLLDGLSIDQHLFSDQP